MASSTSGAEAIAPPTMVLVLQGGGALGAYQVGAYRAMQEALVELDWIAGVSIGSINSWIIVGNEPDRRMEKLEQFWQNISRPDGWSPKLGAALHQIFMFPETAWHQIFNLTSAWEAVFQGQPKFFEPRQLSPFLATTGTAEATSFYNTALLRSTLQDLVDPHIINAAKIRLSLGATNVETGELEFYHNFETPRHTKATIQVDHVMASGSLPPGFPATWIDGKPYWDGGCVSNTPLEAVLADEPDGRTIVFMIDLWNLTGRAPRSMFDVLWRQKEIAYASRNLHAIQAAAAKLLLRPENSCSKKTDGDAPVGGRRMDIVHIIYEPDVAHIPNSDAEFSRESVAERQQAGYRDLSHVLEKKPWLSDELQANARVVVHKVTHRGIESRAGFEAI